MFLLLPLLHAAQQRRSSYQRHWVVREQANHCIQSAAVKQVRQVLRIGSSYDAQCDHGHRPGTCCEATGCGAGTG